MILISSILYQLHIDITTRQRKNGEQQNYIHNATSEVLRTNNHMTNKPWRIVNEYIYFNQNTHSLTIPIVTDVHHILSIGEPICHILPMNPRHTLQSIKGTYGF